MIVHFGHKSFNPRSVTSRLWQMVRFSSVALAIFILFQLAILLHGSWQAGGLSDPHGYVFYATEDSYACSALVNAIHLQTTLATMHPIYLLASSDVSAEYIVLFRRQGVNVIVSPSPPVNSPLLYYKDSLLKMMAFGIFNHVPSLKRVIVLDSDQLILRNLDHLFDLPSVPLAAPRAYWIKEHDHPLTSALMVIEQSAATWAKVENGLKNVGYNQYDMDLVQYLFGDTVMMLPGYYITLNGHWESWDLPSWYTGGNQGAHKISSYERKSESTEQQLTDLWAQTAVLHFTSVGKPWTSGGNVLGMNFDQVIESSHWLFGRQIDLWVRGRAGSIMPGNLTGADATRLGSLGPLYGANQVCLGSIYDMYMLHPPNQPGYSDEEVDQQKAAADAIAEANAAALNMPDYIGATPLIGATPKKETTEVFFDGTAEQFDLPILPAHAEPPKEEPEVFYDGTAA